jgi:hypothetical protein
MKRTKISQGICSKLSLIFAIKVGAYPREVHFRDYGRLLVLLAKI